MGERTTYQLDNKNSPEISKSTKTGPSNALEIPFSNVFKRNQGENQYHEMPGGTEGSPSNF